MISKKWQITALILFSIGLSSCSKNKTELVSSWENKTFDGPQIQKMLVLGVMGNGLQRHIYEDTFVELFQQNDMQAIPSHSLMPKLEDFQDKEKIIQSIKKSGADGIFLAVLIGKDQYQDSQMNRPPQGQQFFNHYRRSYRGLRHSDGQKKAKEVFLQTTLYLTATKEMIWAGSTKSYDPDSAQIVLDGNTKIIKESLAKIGILPQEVTP